VDYSYPAARESLDSQAFDAAGKRKTQQIRRFGADVKSRGRGRRGWELKLLAG